MHHSFKMSYLEPILVHPVRRQNFGDTVAQKCNPYLIRCLIDINICKYDLIENINMDKDILGIKITFQQILELFHAYENIYNAKD